MKTTIQKLTNLLTDSQEQFNLSDFKFIFDDSISIDEIWHRDIKIIDFNWFEIITKRLYDTIYFNILKIWKDVFINNEKIL